MEVYTVWGNNRINVDEKCLIKENGDYIGLTTGNIYPKESHYASEQYLAKIISVDEKNITGMYHLYSELNDNEDENNKTFKSKYIGCYITVEKAHCCGSHLIYRCLELKEYFSDEEIVIINKTINEIKE